MRFNWMKSIQNDVSYFFLNLKKKYIHHLPDYYSMNFVKQKLNAQDIPMSSFTQ